MHFDLVLFVIALALLEYFVFGFLVGRARGTYNVPAPATSGNPIFERYFRVHQNTLEQLVIFVPCMLIFSQVVSTRIAAGLGLVFIVGRLLYLRGYVADPAKRGPGFLIGALAQVSLLLGSVIGAGLKVIG
jgi:uncharacterized MAPEG superfamily protein